MTDEYTTIRIRNDVLAKIDKIRAENAATPIPSKTSRSDVIEAAIDAFEKAVFGTPPAPEPAPKKRGKKS